MIVFASEFCLQTLYVLLFQDIHLLHISIKVKVSLNPTVPKTLAWCAWSDRIFSLTVTSQLRTRMRMWICPSAFSLLDVLEQTIISTQLTIYMYLKAQNAQYLDPISFLFRYSKHCTMGGGGFKSKERCSSHKAATLLHGARFLQGRRNTKRHLWGRALSRLCTIIGQAYILLNKNRKLSKKLSEAFCLQEDRTFLYRWTIVYVDAPWNCFQFFIIIIIKESQSWKELPWSISSIYILPSP